MDFKLKRLLTISFFYATIPLIWKLIIKDHSYNFKENWIIFALLWILVFTYKSLNAFLIQVIVVYFEMKLEFKSQIISMIDRKFAVNHDIKPILPKLNQASSQNIK